MSFDWFEMAQKLAAGARGKAAEDRRRLEELQAQKADTPAPVESPAAGR
jgi:BMFP domain-containing protein YqiC